MITNRFTAYKINYEYVLLSMLFILNYLSFSHIDLALAGYHGFILSDGHILDLHDYVWEKDKYSVNYPVVTYAIFGGWNSILKFFGIASPTGPLAGLYSLWYKVLVTIFYILTIKQIKNLLTSEGFKLDFIDQNNSLFYIISSPWIIFSVFIFSQLDVMGLFFFFWGLNNLLKKNENFGALIIGICFTFKTFHLLAFIPIVLLLNKNFFKILKIFFIAALPYLFIVFIYKDSPNFFEHVINFKVAQKIYDPIIDSSTVKIHLYPFIYFFICIFAYFANRKDDNFYFHIFFLPSLAYGSLFSIINFHPQWLIYFGFFFSISCIFIKSKNVILFLEIISFYLFLSYTVNFYRGNVDQQMITWGPFFHVILNDFYPHISMKYFYITSILKTNVIFTLFSASLIACMYYQWILVKKELKFINLSLSNENIIKIRFLVGLTFFFIPAILCLKSKIYLIIFVFFAFFVSFVIIKKNIFNKK